MPPRRKSPEELALSGALATNPGRYKDRTAPPQPKSPLGKAPRHLDAEHQKVWRQLVSQAPEGLLGSCDAIAVEILSRMVVRMQKGEMQKASEFMAILNLMGKMGMTPGDRTRFDSPTSRVATPDSTDPLSELD